MKYEVAISFLSEDEKVAKDIKERLVEKGLSNIFVYTDCQQLLTGKSLEDALYPVFVSDSCIVVILYRENWGKSGGTLVEKRAISRRRYRSDENFIFIIRMPGETSRPFLEEESIYHDLNKYPIEQSIDGIIRMVKEHREGELNLLNHNSSPREETSNLILFSNLKSWLKSDFYENGLFEGHFGRNKNRALALDVKWQSKDGEAVNSLHYPKYPYYYTFWGYRAALLIAPELVQQYKDKTIKAIRTHYGGDRWIKVERQSSFTEGPITKVRISETVRHTARAANILLFLDPKERLVSQTAWELLNEQKMLQNDDGAWLEFRSEGNSESIWSTIYVYQFLSSLLLIKDINVPDERQAFLDRVIIPIQRSEKYLVKHWQLNRWTPGNNIHWTEGACAVLIEICPYFKNESLLIDCYSVLRNLISPGGRLENPRNEKGAPDEISQALRLAYALFMARPELFQSDTRISRLLEWIAASIKLDNLISCDIAAIANIYNIK